MVRRPTKETELEKFISWIKHLRNASEDRIVLVQHKQDMEKLLELGVKNIVYLTEPHYKAVEQIAEKGKECVLLFNVDKRSDELCERIRAELMENGVKVNTRFRKLLLTTELREIRGILTYLKKHLVLEKEREAMPF